MAALTPNELLTRVLRNLGNLPASVQGQAGTDAINDTLLFLASGLHYADFRGLQSTVSNSISAGSGTTQVEAFTGWAADIWAIVSLHDTTNDEAIIPVRGGVAEIDESTLTSTTTAHRYATWKDDVLFIPPFSATTSVQMRYISTATKFTFSTATNLASGTNPLPQEYDAGFVAKATESMAVFLNPALVATWAAEFRGWDRNIRASVALTQLEDEGSELTSIPVHISHST